MGSSRHWQMNNRSENGVKIMLRGGEKKPKINTQVLFCFFSQSQVGLGTEAIKSEQTES